MMCKGFSRVGGFESELRHTKASGWMGRQRDEGFWCGLAIFLSVMCDVNKPMSVDTSPQWLGCSGGAD